MIAYDVIVIGSGAGGGTLVRRLAPSGKRILLLERGDWLPREPQNWDAARRCSWTTATCRQDTWYDGEGKAVPAAGPLLRRRRDEALRRGALPPARGGLRRAAPPRRHLPGVADLLRGDGAVLHARPSSSTRSTARAARTRPSRRRARRIRSRRSATSRASSSSPTTSRPPATTRSTRRAACMLDEANMPLQRVRALRDLRRLPLPGAREVRRRGARRAAGARAPQRHAADRAPRRCGSRPNATGTAVTGVVVERDGERETYTADIVVVSCGAANSAKLLLASATDAHPHGLANGSDQVGRNYMFHNSQAVLALSKEPNPTVFQKTLGLNDFYFGGGDIDYPLGNIQMVGKSSARDVPRREAAADQARARVDARGGRRATRSTSGCRPRTCRGPTTGSRCATTAASRSPTRRPTRCPRSGCCHELKSMLGHLGMHHDHLVPRHAYLKNDIPVAGVAHQAGTCRFGTDPATSVLDGDCRAHEVDNLYVVDTSFFPSIGAVNPALTAMANAPARRRPPARAARRAGTQPEPAGVA